MAGFGRPPRERVTRWAERTAASPERLAGAPDVEALLRLQAGVGNRVASRLVARAPAGAPAPAPADERGRSGSAGPTLRVAGFGEYAVSSFQAKGANELAVVFDPGSDAARLMQAASRGEPIPRVTIATGGQTIALTEVVIAGFQHIGSAGGGEPLVSVDFNGASLTVD